MANYRNIEIEILNQINTHRKSIGKPALSFEENIQQLCRQHAQSMAAGQTAFGHDGFQQRSDRLLRQLGGSGIAENVAQGQRSALEVVSSWLQSRGHRRNIEGDYNLTGIAVEKDANGANWFTQIFYKWDKDAPAPSTTTDSTAPKMQDLAKLVSDLVNDHRLSNYMPALRPSSELDAIARVHSENMAKGLVPLGHDGFQQRMDEAMRKVGGLRGAENVAMGGADGQKILQGWLNSPGHRKNIDGNYNLSGMGIAQGKNGYWYFTQLFLYK